jgi:hypothetical protein
MQKESQLARSTHVLSDAERVTGKDSERRPASEGNSLSVERRVRDWLGQGKKPSQRGALTNCRVRSEGLIRTAKKSQAARRTHVLSSAERGTGQGSK